MAVEGSGDQERVPADSSVGVQGTESTNGWIYSVRCRCPILSRQGERGQESALARFPGLSELSDETVATLEGALNTFKNQFRTSEGTILGHEAEEEAIAEEEIDRMAITKKVRKG